MKQLFKRIATVVAIICFLFITDKAVDAATRATINIAPWWREQLQQASLAIGEGGGVNVMLCPGDVPEFNQVLAKNTSPRINLWIRGHWPGSGLDEKMAADWAKALAALDTRYKVYFFPVNEPNGKQENNAPCTPGVPGCSVSVDQVTLSPQAVKSYTDTLIAEINKIDPGMIGNKVEIISPVIDPFASVDQQHKYIQALGPSYFNKFYGVSISMYGEHHGGQLAPGPAGKIGDFMGESGFTQYMGINGSTKVFIESGVLCVDGSNISVVYGNDPCGGGKSGDQAISEYFTTRGNGLWGSQRVWGPSIFSYNPDPNPNFNNPSQGNTGSTQDWIYGSQTLNTMKGPLYSNANPVVGYSGSRNAGFDDYLKSLGACYPNMANLKKIVDVECSSYNQKTEITVYEALLIALNEGGNDKDVSLGVQELKPVGSHEAVDLQPYKYLTKAVTRTLPNKFEQRIRESASYGQAAPEGKVPVKYNANDTVISTQSNVCANTKDGAKLISQTYMFNDVDQESMRLANDNGYVLSALFGPKNRIQPQAGVIDNTQPGEVVRNGVDISCSENGTGDMVPVEDRNPTRSNIYNSATGDPVLVTVAKDIIAGLIADFLKTILGEGGAKDFVHSLGIATTIVSCSHTSNIETSYKNSTMYADPKIPMKTVQAIDSQPRDSLIENQFSVTANSGNYAAPIKVKTEHAKEMESSFRSSTCLVMPMHARQNIDFSNEKCIVPLTGGTANPPPIGSGNGENGPQNCSESFMTDAFGARAAHAACIATRETAQCKGFVNTSCTCGPSGNCNDGGNYTGDYSIGLFQINLMWHPYTRATTPPGLRALFASKGLPENSYCPDAFSSKGIIGSNGKMVQPCVVGNQAVVAACTEFFMNPQNNKQYTASVINNLGESAWGYWATAPLCSGI